jgi:hypothetical protein
VHKHPATLTVSAPRDAHSVRDGDRVVRLADDLSEVPQGSELVVEAAIDDEEGVAARLLAR